MQSRCFSFNISLEGGDPKTIDAMLKIYGPIDAAITAAALAARLQQQRA